MPGPFERLLAVLCYVGAMRVPFVALVLPEWAFTIPSGLVFSGAAYVYGRKSSRFVQHHAREGFIWSLQANLLLAGIAALAKGIYHAWYLTGWVAVNALWHLSASAFRWGGVLTTIITVIVMLNTARGETRDALAVGRRVNS